MRGNRIATLVAVVTLVPVLVVRVPFAARGFGLTTQILIIVLLLAFLHPPLSRQADDETGRVGGA